MKLKDLIKENRQKQSMSQSRLAKVLGYSSGQFVSNWERGLSLPPVDRLAKISLLFNVDKEVLIQMYLEEISESKRKDFYKAYDFHISLDKKEI